MSLNKFTDINQQKQWMKINCGELSTPKLTIKANNGSSINMIPDSVGVVNQVLSSNGDGTVDWKTVTGGSGIQNPVLETIYPATNSIDLGKIDAPFRKLYVQNATIELVNPTDPLKSGSISVNDGNLDIKSNLATGNVNLGYLAGVGAGENSTNIGNEAGGTNAGDNVVNLGFQAGKEDCKNNSINIGNGAGIQNSGENSIHIGTLAGSTILGGVNGDSSIAIGQSAGQNNIANNSIILNATGLVLDNLVQDAFIVKPVRDQPSYTKILGYDTSSGEIFSSDEKNTLNPVIIATPQVEKNVETKDDNSNALVVLQPTVGDTELLGGEIRVNNIAKTNNTKISSNNLVFTGVGVDGTYTASSIQIKNVNNRNIQTAFSILLNDQVDSSIRIFLTKTSLDISNPTDRNSQTASNLQIRDSSLFPETSLLTKSSLTLTSPINNTANSFSSTQLSMLDSSLNRSLLTRTALQLFSPASTTISTASLNQTTLEIKNISSTPEVSTLNNQNLNILSPINNSATNLSSTTLAILDIPSTFGTTLDKSKITIIDATQNVSNLTSTALQFFEPSSTTISTAGLNQTALEFKDTATQLEISTLTNGFLNISSAVNDSVSTLSSTTLSMLDIAGTFGTSLDQNQLSIIDNTSNVVAMNPTSLKLFAPTDLLNPATLLNQTKLEIKSTDDRTTVTPTEVKVQNTTFSESCSLVATGVIGTTIDLLPTAGGDISLTVSAGGHILLNGLPSSNAGLPSGALYTHVIGGGHKSVCVV